MNIMVKIYADLIFGGYKTLEQVPEKIREEVKNIVCPEVEVYEVDIE